MPVHYALLVARLNFIRRKVQSFFFFYKLLLNKQVIYFATNSIYYDTAAAHRHSQDTLLRTGLTFIQENQPRRQRRAANSRKGRYLTTLNNFTPKYYLNIYFISL